MKEQNNHISDKRLSAYFDDEIPASEKKSIERHLNECGYCQNRLDQFNQLHEISQQGPEPVLQRDLWTSIDSQIDSLPNTEVPSASYKKWIAAAAIILITLAGGWLLLEEKIGAMEQDSPTDTSVNQYAFDYGLYLSGLDNPDIMKKFNDGYKRKKVELAGMAESSTVQADSAVLKNLPQGFSLESAYLLESACCQCRQYTLQRNGKQITVFQQPKKHPAEFTGYHQKHATINSSDCSKIETKKHTALSFDAGNSKYVVVGSSQNPMLPAVMHQLNDNH